MPGEVATAPADRPSAEPVLESPPAGLPIAPLENTNTSSPASVEPVEARPGEDSPFGELPRADAHGGELASAVVSVPPPVASSRAARYMQPRVAKPIRPVSRQDVDRVARLYDTGDVAQLVLNFGQYRGATMLQVAAMDPDYVRQLALAAQRPEVRAAARQLVIALEEVAAHRPRTARRTGRRAPASG
jgi:hypothetical protein